MNVSDFLVARLAAWGVRRVYGYPGDGINGILGALQREGHGVRFIQARHEEMAAFMACGDAKYSGDVGVCLATSGPGAIQLLNGLYDAKMDHAPVVAIVGQSATTAMGGDYQQEVDLHALFKDVAHEYVHTAMSPEAVRHLVDRAVRIARSERTVTCIIVPKDVQEMDAVEAPRHAHDTVHTSVGYSVPRVIPSDDDLARAAEILNAGERVAMLVGHGAAGASDEVIAVADALGAGVAKALLGRAVLPDALPFVTGSIGLLGTRPSWEMMQRCDTLLMVGSSFPYAEFLPKEGQARGVQVELDGRRVGLRYPMELGLVGDARETLRALLPRLTHKTDRAWRDELVTARAEWDALLRERTALAANPVNPMQVFAELSPRLPEGSIVSVDSGTSAVWFALLVHLRQGMLASASGSLASMGCAVPYAIAAKFAFPDRPALALVGDGAMQMNGNAELVTVAKYWRTWADPRLVVLVLRNDDLNMVTWEMRSMAGDPKFAASQDLPAFPYAQYAEMIGLRGIRASRPDEVAGAWDEALRADRPCVFEVQVDPDVPPLAPHMTLDQMKAFGMSLLKNDPDRAGVIQQTLRHLFPSIGRKAGA